MILWLNFKIIVLQIKNNFTYMYIRNWNLWCVFLLWLLSMVDIAADGYALNTYYAISKIQIEINIKIYRIHFVMTINHHFYPKAYYIEDTVRIQKKDFTFRDRNLFFSASSIHTSYIFVYIYIYIKPKYHYYSK